MGSETKLLLHNWGSSKAQVMKVVQYQKKLKLVQKHHMHCRTLVRQKSMFNGMPCSHGSWNQSQNVNEQNEVLKRFVMKPHDFKKKKKNVPCSNEPLENIGEKKIVWRKSIASLAVMGRHPSKTNRLPLSSWRFTNIVKTPTSPTSPQAIRAKMAAAQQASSANRRLAQQMANRPTVQAALKIKKVSSGVPLHWLHVVVWRHYYMDQFINIFWFFTGVIY